MTLVATIAAAAVIAGVIVIRLRSSGGHPTGPPCRVTVGRTVYGLDLEQAANATTIAAIGKRLSMPDHAVTIAVAAALQESGLHNLDHGDLDSLGLFQQRPSQGWGTPAQIMTPRYAATAFYHRLVLVEGWQGLSVAAAAQDVQRSAAPNAYADWEQEARSLAIAMTGEAPAGLACRVAVEKTVRPDPGYVAAMSSEVGISDLRTVTPPARGWMVAAWLVGHAAQYRIHSVSYDDQRWTGASAAWRTLAQPVPGVSVG